MEPPPERCDPQRNSAATGSEQRPVRSVLNALSRFWAVGLLAALVFGSALMARPLTFSTITIDGLFEDWENALADPDNLVLDRTRNTPDPDEINNGPSTMTSDRDMIRAATTWDSDYLYFFVKVSDSVNRAIKFFVHVDSDDDGLMEAGEWVLEYGYNGYGPASSVNAYAYVPASAGGDAMTGDGVPMPGTLDTKVTSTTMAATMLGSMVPSTGAGPNIYMEGRVGWASMGLASGAPLRLHFTTARNLSLGPYAGGSSVEDNAELLRTSYTRLDLYPDRESPSLPGTDVVYTHTLSQSANLTDTVRLSAMSVNGWTTTVFDSGQTTITSLVLRGNETTTVQVRVSVPATVTYGTMDTLYLSVESSRYPDVTDRVMDKTYVGGLVVYPDRSGTIATGAVASYQHYVANMTATTLTVDLSAHSYSPWPVGVFDAAGTSPTSTIVLPPGAQTMVSLNATCPTSAALGATDVSELRAEARGDGAPSDRARDITTVWKRIDIRPDHVESAAPGSVINYRHTVTNSWPASDTVYLSASYPSTWTVRVLESNGVTPTSSFELGPGESRDIIVRVKVPSTADAGLVATVTITATSSAVALPETATDRTTVYRLTTYADPGFRIPQDVFRLGETVYGLSGGLIGYSEVLYRWLRPAYTVATETGGITVIDNQAEHSYTVPTSETVGFWHLGLYSDLTPVTTMTVATFTVTYDAEIVDLRAPDAASSSATVLVDSTLRNNGAATITASSVEYRVWWDANGDGVYGSGDYSVDASGALAPYSADATTHVTAVSTVLPEGTFGEPGGGWELSNALFDYTGMYRVTATWRTSSGVFIDDAETMFYSPGDIPELTLEKVLASGQTSMVAGGRVATFTITVRNTGDTTLTSIPMRDTFDPAYLTYSTATPAPTSESPGSLRWSHVATLAPGESTVVTVALVAGPSPPSHVATNSVSSTEALDAGGVAPEDASDSATITIDDTFPVTTDTAPAAWQTTSPISVTLSATDTISGVYRTYYRLNNGTLTTYTVPVEITAEGTNTLVYYSVDNAGNVESVTTATVLVDTLDPATTYFGPSGDTSAVPTVTLVATDTVSGVASTWYSIDGAVPVLYVLPFAVPGEGPHTVSYYSVDVAGNAETSGSASFTVDTTAPDVTIGVVTQGGSYATSQTPTVTITDAATWTVTLNGHPTPRARRSVRVSGRSRLRPPTSSGAPPPPRWTSRSTHPPRSSPSEWSPRRLVRHLPDPDRHHHGCRHLDGDPERSPVHHGHARSVRVWTLEASATDEFGRTTTSAVDFTVDTTPPLVTIGVVTQGGSYATSQTPTVIIADAATWTVTLNGSPYTTGTPIGEGVWTIEASATDEFGRSTTAAVDFEIDTSPPDVTIGVVTQGGSYATSQTPTVTIADAATWTVTLNGSPYTTGTPIGEGIWTIEASATDEFGRTTTSAVDFTVDTTPPLVTIGVVTQGGSYATSQTPTVIITDAATWTVTLNGSPYTTGTPIGEGVWTIEASATDEFGRSTTSAVDFEIDTSAPLVTIGVVTQGGSYATSQTPSVTIADAATWTVTLNGSPYTTGTPIGEGVWTIEASATDEFGRTTTSAVDFTVDTTPPLVTIGVVTQGGSYATSQTPTVTIADAATWTVTLNGNPYTTGTPIGEGSWTIEASATDEFGRSTTATVDFEIDTSAPLVTIGVVTQDGSYATSQTPTVTIADAATWTVTLNGNPYTTGTPIGEGVWTIEASATDEFGRTTTSAVDFTVDTTPPLVTIGVVTQGGSYATSQTPTVAIADAATWTVTLNGNPYATGTPIGEGTWTIETSATDEFGRTTTSAVDFVIDIPDADTSAPVVTITPEPAAPDGDNGWYVTTPTIAISASEPTTWIRYSLTGAAPWSEYTTTLTVATPGTTTVWAYARDLAGNESTPTSATVLVDTLDPATTYFGPSGDTSAVPTVTLTATDTVSGLASTWYSIDGAVPVLYVLPFAVPGEGPHTVAYYSVDVAGNTETSGSASFDVDTTPPDVTIGVVTQGGSYATSQTPTVAIADAATWTVTLNGSPYTTGTPIGEGVWTIEASATDEFGRTTTAAVDFEIDTSAPDVTIGVVTQDGSYATSQTPTVTIADAATWTVTLNGSPYTTGTPIGEGVWTIEASATDEFGRTTTSAVDFTVDTTPPLVTIGVVTQGGSYATSQTPTVIIADAATWTVTLNGSPYTTGTPIGEGVWTIEASATDEFGRTTTSAVDFTVDTTPPLVTIGVVTQGGSYATSQTPTVTIADAATWTVTLNGSPYATGTPIGEGVWTIEASATDEFGRTTTSAVDFTVDTTPPLVTIGVVTQGGSYATSQTPTVTIADAATWTVTLNGNPYTTGTPIGEGVWTIEASATDEFGRTTTSAVDFTVDTTPPLVTIGVVTQGGSYATSQTPTVTIADAATWTVTLNGSPYTTGTPIGEGVWTIEASATDEFGRTTTSAVDFVIDIPDADTSAPVVTITPEPAGPDGANGWYVTTPTIAISASEPTTWIRYSLTGAAPWSEYTTTLTVATPGTTTVWAYARDLAGNESTPTSATVLVDTLDPATTYFGPSGDTSAVPTITLTATDTVSGLASTWYSIDGAVPVLYVLPFAVPGEGPHTVTYYSVDVAGNAETSGSASFTIDTTPPLVTIGVVTQGGSYATSQTPTVAIADAATWTVTLNGSPYTTGTPIGEGSWTIEASATDEFGRTTTSAVDFTVDTTPPLVTIGVVTQGGSYATSQTPTVTIADAATWTVTLNGNPYTTGTPIGEGSWTIEASATDEFGRSTTATVDFEIDTSAPLVTIGVVTQDGSYATSQTPTVTIADAATWTVTLNGNPYTTGTPIGEGVWTIEASATDEFGRTTTASSRLRDRYIAAGRHHRCGHPRRLVCHLPDTDRHHRGCRHLDRDPERKPVYHRNAHR